MDAIFNGHRLVVDTIEEPEELGTTVGFRNACTACGWTGELFCDINDAGDDIPTHACPADDELDGYDTDAAEAALEG